MTEKTTDKLPLPIFKEKIKKLLEDYRDGKMTIFELEYTGEELKSVFIKEYKETDEYNGLNTTLMSIYKHILCYLEFSFLFYVFPEDISIMLEYLETKEDDDILAARRKFHDYWQNLRNSPGYCRWKEGIKRGYWEKTKEDEDKKLLEDYRPLLFFKEKIKKLLEDYRDGKMTIFELEYAGEDLSDFYVKEYGGTEEYNGPKITLMSVYGNILADLDSAVSGCFFPEDVPATLEYLETKEGADVPAARQKYCECWQNVINSPGYDREEEGKKRGYW